MSIQDFFKLIGLDISFNSKEATGCYNIEIIINHTSRNWSKHEPYKTNVYYTSSNSNCGLLYFDGFNNIACGKDNVDYFLDSKVAVKWRALSNEDKNELGLLYTKYIIYQSWKNLNISKSLVFMHTGYKSNNGSFSKEICIPFMDIVDAYFESPINTNSGRTQLHGVVDIHNLQNIEVPDKFITHFKDE